ncbi:MAG: glyceraldehyde 3-phosphate dehydrogenase NAD-binding domain-containing protein [Thermodesulfobacteriota bacterium]
MGYRLAINGYGRIGRCVLRALYESGRFPEFEVVGINDLSHIEAVAHLTRFDSTHGPFQGEVAWEDSTLLINGHPIAVSSEKDTSRLPWGKLGVDAVMECSGAFTQRAVAEGHIRSGARKVIFSCPAGTEVDATIVYGINEQTLKNHHTIISNASCTSNCIVPVIHVLDCHLGIRHGMITTIHSMMNDQPVIDAYHNRDLRKSRSSSQSVIPVDTALPGGVDRLLPHLAGRFQAIALRVPITNVSAMQLTVQVNNKTDVREVNRIMKTAAEGKLAGILGYTELPLVSCDFNHDPRSAVIDGSQTRVFGGNALSGGTGVSVLAWFDNEWGFANRMLDTARALLKV